VGAPEDDDPLLGEAALVDPVSEPRLAWKISAFSSRLQIEEFWSKATVMRTGRKMLRIPTVYSSTR